MYKSGEQWQSSHNGLKPLCDRVDWLVQGGTQTMGSVGGLRGEGAREGIITDRQVYTGLSYKQIVS